MLTFAHSTTLTPFMNPLGTLPNTAFFVTTIMDAQGMGADDWGELQRNLLATIPVYDRINRFATMGQVSSCLLYTSDADDE